MAQTLQGSRQHADALAAELNQQTPIPPAACKADLLDTAALPGLVGRRRALGRLDALVNNASSFSPPAGPDQPDRLG